MTAARRDLASFARAVEALEPFRENLVFVGGWAHYLYTLRPEASPLPFEPLRTEDADVAAPARNTMHAAHVRAFQNRALSDISEVTDLVRRAAKLASERPSPPSPDILLAALRRGLAAAFDLRGAPR